jgi:hypothetical protein
MAALAQLVDDSRAAVARFVLDVDGADLGEQPLVGELALRRPRATPRVVRAP